MPKTLSFTRTKNNHDLASTTIDANDKISEILAQAGFKDEDFLKDFTTFPSDWPKGKCTAKLNIKDGSVEMTTIKTVGRKNIATFSCIIFHPETNEGHELSFGVSSLAEADAVSQMIATPDRTLVLNVKGWTDKVSGEQRRAANIVLGAAETAYLESAGIETSVVNTNKQGIEADAIKTETLK